jgi:hypothetical protein
MKLYTRLTKEQFIDELKGLTTHQVPSMFKESTGQPFWGFIKQDELTIKSNNQYIPNMVEMVGTVSNGQKGATIEIRIRKLFFPLTLFLISTGLGSFTFLIESIQNMNYLRAGLSLIYGVIMITIILFAVNKQGDWLINKFIKNTSANNGEHAGPR